MNSSNKPTARQEVKSLPEELPKEENYEACQASLGKEFHNYGTIRETALC